MDQNTLTGRCYCGAHSVSATAAPVVVTYCHCTDCRRLSGAPVSAFAGFAAGSLAYSPKLGPGRSHFDGVTRWFCEQCGSQLAASYDYIPDQLYTPVGLWDQADQLPPARHAHHTSRLDWMELADDLPRDSGSARSVLNEAGACMKR